MWSWWKNWGVCAEFTASNDVTFDSCKILISMCFLSQSSAEVMELLIQSSDLFVMQVEMDVYTALKKVCIYNFHKPLFCAIMFQQPFLSCFCLCSGCFSSSTPCGTAPSSSFLQTLMRGCANAEPVTAWKCVSIFASCLFVWSVEIVLPHRSVWERALFGHRRWFSLLFCFQTRPSPAYHQRFGVGTRPGEGQHFASW